MSLLTAPSGPSRKVTRRKQTAPTRLQVEALEERNLLSTNYPLDPVQWTALGPAPVVTFGNMSTGRIAAVAAHPTDANTIYVAVGALAVNGLTGDTGIWKSTDGGATWNPMINGIASLSDNDAVSDLAMDPSNSQHLFAAIGTPGGSQANGIYQTFDGGA